MFTRQLLRRQSHRDHIYLHPSQRSLGPLQPQYSSYSLKGQAIYLLEQTAHSQENTSYPTKTTTTHVAVGEDIQGWYWSVRPKARAEQWTINMLFSSITTAYLFSINFQHLRIHRGSPLYSLRLTTAQALQNEVGSMLCCQKDPKNHCRQSHVLLQQNLVKKALAGWISVTNMSPLNGSVQLTEFRMENTT